ncbi:MAG: hypothetical protein NC432_02270 [Roseburia sp.]|nr:hypothetical protein [Roseburia sp.]MCM1097483.1 hypothetical protein [Ruminococcus flavefaciens]
MSSANKAVCGVGMTNGTYQWSVAQRALQRAGHCKNLKGHVLEICYKDRFNADVRNIAAGRRAYLTKSPIAVRDDIVVKQNGCIVKRFQCKDTPSGSGVQDTVKRIKEGQYSRTNVVGTTETAEAVNRSLERGKAKTETRVQNSGISSKTTELIACQANGANPFKHLGAVGHYAGDAAKGGAIVGGTFSIVKNGNDVLKKRQDADEAVTGVVYDTGKSAASAALAGAVDVSVTMAVAMVPPLAPAAKPIGIAAGMAVGFTTNTIFKAVEKCIDRHIDKVVEHRINSADDSYCYLKKKGFI